MERIILHVDMDAFFASVEQLDNKALRGKPVIVGGVRERGVVSTCSYQARKYGVHSAMPVFMARNLCPNGIFVPVRMQRYKEISRKVFEIFKEVTDIVEPLSIDEAYLDLTNNIRFKSGMEASMYIKRRVFKEIGLTLSVGISYNKFLAKTASDWNKPNGIKEIKKEMMPEILFDLDIKNVYGLGKKSVHKLNNMGLYKIKDLYKLDKDFFIKYLGKNGLEVYDRIRGIDNREFNIDRKRKSIGKERTLKTDTEDKDELKEYIMSFSKEIKNILDRDNKSFKTIVLKYKTKSFKNHTRSKTLNSYIKDEKEIIKEGLELLENEEFNEPIRLIGLSVTSFKETMVEQIKLF